MIGLLVSTGVAKAALAVALVCLAPSPEGPAPSFESLSDQELIDRAARTPRPGEALTDECPEVLVVDGEEVSSGRGSANR